MSLSAIDSTNRDDQGPKPAGAGIGAAAATQGAPAQSPKFSKNDNILIICAILLQETVNTSIQTTSVDAKAVSQQSAEMEYLDAKERALNTLNLVFEHDWWHTWVTRKGHPGVDGAGGYWSTTKHKSYHQDYKATAARCQVELKQQNAEKEAIAGAFGQAQITAQNPLTQLNSDSNSIQQEQQQGLGILILFQQLMFAALQKRQV